MTNSGFRYRSPMIQHPTKRFSIEEPQISVVIPTWNEQFWLPRLLERLIKLPQILEIIVADNNSSDATKHIAKQNGCILVPGGTPAVGRNNGARIAQGDVIVFLDADVIISQDIIDCTIHSFVSENIVALHLRAIPITKSRFIRFCYSTMDIYFGLLSKCALVQGVGHFIAVRRDAFNEAGGFDVNIVVGEDADVYRRLSKIGKVKYDRDMSLFVSARRFTIESGPVFALKCIIWSFLRLLGSKRSVWGYIWDEYSQRVADEENQLLDLVFDNEQNHYV